MTKEQAIKTVGSDLGTPGKMPGYSFSLSALNCITGAKLHDVPDSVCHKCYAWNRAGYAYTVVKNAQARRLAKLNNPKWVEAMVTLIKNKTRRKRVKQLHS